jgi:NAD+ kinase
MLNLENPLPLPTVLGSGFVLRAFRLGDEVSLQKYMNDERVARDVTHIPFPYTLEHADAWVNQTSLMATSDSTRVDFVIDIDGEVAGSVAFINVDGHKAQVSMWVSPRYWRRGIATAALKLLVQFGFARLGLVRIYAYHYTENQKTGGVLEKAGFHYEGTHAKEWRKELNGEVRLFDSNYYSIVNTNTRVRSVALVAASGDGYSHVPALVERYVAMFERLKVVVHRDFGAVLPRVDLAISLGGDGTMMRTVTQFSTIGVPTFGINAGDVGFLTSSDAEEVVQTVCAIVAGEYRIERRIALRFKFRGTLYGPFANEVLIAHQSRGIAHVKVSLGSTVLFEDLPADGVLVATATGSTAYNLSAGGPIIMPESTNVVVNALNPQRLNMRPVVSEILAAGGTVTLHVVASKRNEPLAIAADSLYLTEGPQVGESVEISRDPQPLLFATFGHDQFVCALKAKLNLVR